MIKVDWSTRIDLDLATADFAIVAATADQSTDVAAAAVVLKGSLRNYVVNGIINAADTDQPTDQSVLCCLRRRSFLCCCRSRCCWSNFSVPLLTLMLLLLLLLLINPLLLLLLLVLKNQSGTMSVCWTIRIDPDCWSGSFHCCCYCQQSEKRIGFPPLLRTESATRLQHCNSSVGCYVLFVHS